MPKTFYAGSVRLPDSLSEAHKVDALRMAEIYPMIYAFENSVREFIDGHLTATLGKDWFDDPKVVSKGVLENVKRAKEAEGRHRYHSRRNARPIYYTNIDDLGSMVMSEKGWPVFKSVFPSDKWVPSVIERIEMSRNVVAHMNPLQKKDITRITVAYEDWLEQIRGHDPPQPG